MTCKTACHRRKSQIYIGLILYISILLGYSLPWLFSVYDLILQRTYNIKYMLTMLERERAKLITYSI